MKRLPLIPTLVVALACAAMIGLGVWQLKRLAWKEALIARYSANLSLPPMNFPASPFGDDALLFRKAQATCVQPGGWTRRAGRSASGASGWLLIAHCRPIAGITPFRVALGVTRDPNRLPAWSGGEVTGWITQAPSQSPLIANLFGMAPASEVMLQADKAPPGLEAAAPPDPTAVPNNHLAYAVQWFLFAAIAAAIYVLALRKRSRASAQ